MLESKGASWRPSGRQIWHIARNTKTLFAIGLLTIFIWLWHSAELDTVELSGRRFHCWGPKASTPGENPFETTVVNNAFKPIQLNSTTIEHIDLDKVESTVDALQKRERILILTPVRDVVPYLARHFELLSQLTYPHSLIDLAFLVGDSKDDTMRVLAEELEKVQQNPDLAFRSAIIIKKNFGVTLSQSTEDRHSFKAQGPRRKALGKARNYLLATALKQDHSWVYWRDVDIVESPDTIIEDFIKHDRDVLVPNIWFHRWKEQDGKKVDLEGRYDYNSWQETPDSLKMLSTLDKDVILAECYAEVETKRKNMALMGSSKGDKNEEIPLDGIGGVNIIVKADVHRSGINFPCYPFENQAETEGFAKMAKRAGYEVFGLPNYIVWHIDTKEMPE